MDSTYSWSADCAAELPLKQATDTDYVAKRDTTQEDPGSLPRQMSPVSCGILTQLILYQLS